jgi:hypothetical protein
VRAATENRPDRVDGQDGPHSAIERRPEFSTTSPAEAPNENVVAAQHRCRRRDFERSTEQQGRRLRPPTPELSLLPTGRLRGALRRLEVAPAHRASEGACREGLAAAGTLGDFVVVLGALEQTHG